MNEGKPHNRARYITTIVLARDALKKPITTRAFSEATDMSRKSADGWIKTLHELKKIKPIGTQPRMKGVSGTAPILWQWVGD